MGISNYGDGGVGIFNYVSSGNSGTKEIYKPCEPTTDIDYILPKIDYSADYVKYRYVVEKINSNDAHVNVKPGVGQSFIGQTDLTNFSIKEQSKSYSFIAVSTTQWRVLLS
jgi:hypothetical protein